MRSQTTTSTPRHRMTRLEWTRTHGAWLMQQSHHVFLEGAEKVAETQ